MDIHGYIHGFIHVWILDLGYSVDISMDIVQCTPLKCMPVKEVFQRLLGQLLPASSKQELSYRKQIARQLHKH